MTGRETSLPQSREEHREFLANASADFRAGVAYACELVARELFWGPLRGEPFTELVGRLGDEAARIQSEGPS